MNLVGILLLFLHRRVDFSTLYFIILCFISYFWNFLVE
nr:MAG TPA: hypothetical protein [Caudoviricetes sp.]